MNRLTYCLRGFLRLRLTGAAVSWFLNTAAEERLPFWDVVLRDEFTLELSVPLKMRKKAFRTAERAMCQIAILGEGGAPRRFRALSGRVALVAAIVLAALISTELSSRVWFFRVEGNTTVPSARILRAVQSCGVTYGTRGTDIHPQTIKNRVLEEMEELVWLTVTHNGSDAIITVREREIAPEIQGRKEYCDLVAKREGVVTSVTVLEGAASVQVGQSVAAGDVLISGEIPLEQTVRICGATGTVYAGTTRRSDIVTPQKVGEKEYGAHEKRRISLLFGKKRIKIYEDGGIFDSKCDKMTEVKPISLSGGRVLPIAIETERFLPFQIRERVLKPSAAEEMLRLAVRQAAERDMVDGTILHLTSDVSEGQGVYSGEMVLEANEMIAVKSSIRMITGDTNDGARNQRGENGAAD